MKYLIFCLPAAVLFLIVYACRCRKWWQLLLAAVMGGALPGAFIGAAASAMASAQSTSEGVIRGGAYGAASGLITGAVLLGLIRLITGKGRKGKALPE